MIRQCVFSIIAFIAGLSLAGPANALVMKHTYTGFVQFSDYGCPASELNDDLDCTAPDPIFGSHAYELNNAGISIAFTFRTGTSEPKFGYSGPMKITLTALGVTRILNGFGGAGIGAQPCDFPVYISLCKGEVGHSVTVSDGSITGGGFYYSPMFWYFGETPPYSEDLNAEQVLEQDRDDQMGGIGFADIKTGRSINLAVFRESLVSERVSSIPLPPSLALLGSGLLLLGFWSSRRDRESLRNRH